MQHPQTNKPVVLNLDKHFSDLTEKESYFILNHTSLLSVNGGKKGNTGTGKPMPANYPACDIQQPAGEVYTVGGYRSPLTKEVYSWHINSNGVNYILRTKETGCQIVYYDGCLNLSAEPKHSIENWRAFLHIEKICANRHGKYLKWTTGEGNIHMLDVEASIATDSFTTPFFQTCADDCAMLDMCVPDPCNCLQAEWVPMPDSEKSLNNMMLDAPFMFIYQHVYYDGRKSEWSIPSTTYYQSTKGIGSVAGLSRAIKLRVPVGNPMVEKINIGFTVGGNFWFITETVEKYKKYNNSQEKWYERSLSDALLNYSDGDCSFDYIFYNDRQRIQIDPKEISRVYNPIPRNAQGMIQINESDGVYNYEQGNCPLDKKEVEKFQITPDCTQQNACTIEFATVTVRAFIQGINLGGFVFREGIVGEPDDPTKTAYFGSSSHADSLSYGQQFLDQTRNFIAAIGGTDLWVEMKQGMADNGFINRNADFGIMPIPVGRVPNNVISLYESGKYMYLEAKIRVPKGMKGYIQLVSHQKTDGALASQSTSTYVMGTYNDIRNYVNGQALGPFLDQVNKQIYFDTCNGDTELFEAFVIRDCSCLGSGSAYTGYMKDEDGNPTEGLQVDVGGNIESTTDHNGFYFFQLASATSASIGVQGEQDCGSFVPVKSTTITGALGVTTNQDLTITQGNYKNDMFAEVIVPVRDCNNKPISGIRVALTGTNYKISDANGNATFRVRNYSTRDRFVRAVAINLNGYYTKDCNGACNPCMATASSSLPACFVHTPDAPTVTLSALVVNTDSVINELNGLKSGGRYEFAFLLKGACGKISAAYPTRFVNIPKTQEKGYFGFCEFDYSANGFVAPDWADCLQILRSVNLNNYELQWKVDKIDRTSDGKIKLTIQSLSDYNLNYAFKTNTTYQWVKGDRVEFIYNGDGSIFTSAVNNGILNYLIVSPFHDQVISGDTEADADFFNQILIEDDGRLDDLKEGAIIEFQRPVAAQSEQIYYSICAVIPIVGGQLLNPVGSFTTFDTFLVPRTIPSVSGSFFGVFEHHSPSDFWGERVSDQGKRYVANQYENEKRYGRYISINSPTNFNYFGDLVKKFDAIGQGDITAMSITDNKVIIAICENDNFMAQSADDLVRVGNDGVIRALPADAIISDGEPKIYGAYGCQYDDIGSIFFGDGFVTWVDSNKRAHVHHDYNAASNASLSKTETYFRIKCQEKEKHNLAQSDPFNKYRWSTGLNFSNGEVYLTLKTLRLDSVNNNFNPYTKKNTTIIYHPDLKEYLGLASFTPEFYSQLVLSDDRGCAFLVFSQGNPFVHPIISDKYNEFFGIAVDEVVGVVINKFPEKEKLGQAMEVQSEMLWFASEITTDKATFVSEIPAIRWKKSNGKWNASFLYNKNSRAGLYGNSKEVIPEDTRGRFLSVTLVRDNTDALKYGTIDNAKRTRYNELDLIFSKFQLIEQSGFTENL